MMTQAEYNATIDSDPRLCLEGVISDPAKRRTEAFRASREALRAQLPLAQEVDLLIGHAAKSTLYLSSGALKHRAEYGFGLVGVYRYVPTGVPIAVLANRGIPYEVVATEEPHVRLAIHPRIFDGALAGLGYKVVPDAGAIATVEDLADRIDADKLDTVPITRLVRGDEDRATLGDTIERIKNVVGPSGRYVYPRHISGTYKRWSVGRVTDVRPAQLATLFALRDLEDRLARVVPLFEAAEAKGPLPAEVAALLQTARAELDAGIAILDAP